MMSPTWTVQASKEVDDWIAASLSDAQKRKLVRAGRAIGVAGRLAGSQFLRKMNGRDELWETRIDDWRVFGTFSGAKYLMVVAKRKQTHRLSARDLDVVERQVRSYVGSVE